MYFSMFSMSDIMNFLQYSAHPSTMRTPSGESNILVYTVNHEFNLNTTGLTIVLYRAFSLKYVRFNQVESQEQLWK